MIFTPVSHYKKFMVIPFVYADKSSLFHEIFLRTRYEVIWLIQPGEVDTLIFFILLLSTKRVDCANNYVIRECRLPQLWKRSRKVSFYRNSRSIVDDEVKFRERGNIVLTIVREIYYVRIL